MQAPPPVYEPRLIQCSLYLESPWSEPSVFNGIISRAMGLFIFIKNVAVALEHCKHSTEFLEATLQDSVGHGLQLSYHL